MPKKAARVTQGVPQDLSDYANLLYHDLRRVAGRYFKGERQGHTLQATALVHEAFLRLAEKGPETYKNRAHFFACIARVMRELLVDAARTRKTVKRWGRAQRVSLDGIDVSAPEVPDYLAIDSALERLAAFDSRSAQIAEMRIFAGFSTPETAEALGLASSTVRARWAMARAWLEQQLGRA